MNGFYAIAIDGPSGAGKSTLAKKLAETFNFIYVDTGAIYRTLGLACYRAGIDRKDPMAVMAILSGIQIDIGYNEMGEQRMVLDGEDVSAQIRLPEISLAASDVSAIPEVRAFLLEMQRRFARENHVIMDGRDIGTVVLPQAELKIFLTASPEARALRRLKDLRQKGIEEPYEQVLQEIKDREADHEDRAADRENLRRDIQPPLLLKPAVQDILRSFHPAVEGDERDHRRLFGRIAVEKQGIKQIKHQGRRHQADRKHARSHVLPKRILVAGVRHLVLPHTELPQVHEEIGGGIGHDEIAGMLGRSEMRQDHEQQHGLERSQTGRHSVPDHCGTLNVACLT